jgi:hypothetical protein
MPNLIIRKKISSVTFGTWQWQKNDYERPLIFQLDGAQAQIFVEAHEIEDSPLSISYNLQFVLIFSGAPHDYIAALQSRGDKSTKFAQRVYDYFVETLSRFEAILRVSGNVRNLISMGSPSIHNFYEDSGFSREGVTWQIEDQKINAFTPKLSNKPRGKSPLFKHPQLVTVDKWKRFQKDIDAGRYPSEDIIELHRLAGRVYPKDKRMTVVEAAILIESKLKTYGEKILPEKGFSKAKIKELRDELGFNNVLNLVLPLTLSKSDLRRVNTWRPRIDRIRKLRNDIVHNDLSDDAISDKEVFEGIFAAMDLFEFIEARIRRD